MENKNIEIKEHLEKELEERLEKEIEEREEFGVCSLVYWS